MCDVKVLARRRETRGRGNNIESRARRVEAEKGYSFPAVSSELPRPSAAGAVRKLLDLPGRIGPLLRRSRSDSESHPSPWRRQRGRSAEG